MRKIYLFAAFFAAVLVSGCTGPGNPEDPDLDRLNMSDVDLKAKGYSEGSELMLRLNNTGAKSVNTSRLYILSESNVSCTWNEKYLHPQEAKVCSTGIAFPGNPVSISVKVRDRVIVENFTCDPSPGEETC
jgi:hypothetical protein